jgi:hypothetical protein
MIPNLHDGRNPFLGVRLHTALGGHGYAQCQTVAGDVLAIQGIQPALFMACESAPSVFTGERLLNVGKLYDETQRTLTWNE